MALIYCTKSGLVVTCGLKAKIFSLDEAGTLKSTIEITLPPPVTLKKPDENGHAINDNIKESEAKDSRSILGGCVSKDGTELALCDGRKQLTLWNCDDWSLIHQWPLLRKANKVTFSPDMKSLLVADKGGDVIQYSITGPSTEAVCVLGHLSMLLDITFSSCGRFVVTSDRDEKIRVSHFPNAYSINNFCLGHTEFVTAISLCPHNPSLLTSVSGDGSLKVWKYLDGVQLSSRICSQDLPDGVVSESMDSDEQNGGGGDDEKVKKCEFPAVTSVYSLQTSDDQTLLLVTVDRVNGILVYSMTGSDGNVSFLQFVPTKTTVWDLLIDDKKFISGGDLFVLHSENHGSHLSRFQISDDGLKEVSISASDQNSSLDELLTAVETSQTRFNVDVLYKRWFDNMQDYLERKEERMKKPKTTKESVPSHEEVKRLKLDTK